MTTNNIQPDKESVMTVETTTPKAPRKAPVKTPVKAVAKTVAPKAPAKAVAKAPTQNNTEAKPRRSMSDDHKNALAQGRNEGRAVNTYLNALETNRPKRGRKRTAESIARRLEIIEQKLDEVGPIHRLQLIQERLDLQTEANRLQETNDLSKLEEEFIKVAKSYGARKGITSAAWRSLKVPKNVLQKAGL